MTLLTPVRWTLLGACVLAVACSGLRWHATAGHTTDSRGTFNGDTRLTAEGAPYAEFGFSGDVFAQRRRPALVMPAPVVKAPRSDDLRAELDDLRAEVAKLHADDDVDIMEYPGLVSMLLTILGAMRAKARLSGGEA